jgi:hypothetical protein
MKQLLIVSILKGDISATNIPFSHLRVQIDQYPDGSAEVGFLDFAKEGLYYETPEPMEMHKALDLFRRIFTQTGDVSICIHDRFLELEAEDGNGSRLYDYDIPENNNEN